MRHRLILALALALLSTPPAQAASCSAETGIGPMLAAVNSLRASRGLGALAASAQLDRAAAAHACDMAARGVLDHRGSDGSNFTHRIKRAGYRSCAAAENIANGYPSPERVFAGWQGSKPHLANLLNRKVRQVGLARARAADGQPYWVMVLAAGC